MENHILLGGLGVDYPYLFEFPEEEVYEDDREQETILESFVDYKHNKVIRIQNSCFNNNQRTATLMRLEREGLMKLTKSLGPGSLILEFPKSATEDSRIKLIENIENFIKKAMENEYKPSLYSSPSKITGRYYCYLLCPGDKVIWRGVEWKIVSRNGGPRSFAPQYRVERFDEVNSKKIFGFPVESSLKVMNKPTKFYIITS